MDAFYCKQTYRSYDLLFSFNRKDRQNQCNDAFSNGMIFGEIPFGHQKNLTLPFLAIQKIEFLFWPSVLVCLNFFAGGVGRPLFFFVNCATYKNCYGISSWIQFTYC
jgi:hypothetical protein